MKYLRLLLIFFPIMFFRFLAKGHAKKLEKNKKNYDFNKAMFNARKCCRLVSWYKGVKINIINKPKIKKFIIVANHTNAYDIIALLQCSPTPTTFVSKIELKKSFITGPIARSIGTYFIDRKNIRQAIKTLKKVESDFSNHNHAVTIFPEGTRRDELGEFQIGAFKTAKKIQTYVLPVALINTDRKIKLNKKAVIDIVCAKPILMDKNSNPLKVMSKSREFISETINKYKEKNNV